MAITAKDVMSLRQRTGMGMMECKKALAEADGDFQAAVEILRAAAKGKMDERTDRAAAEGTLAVSTDDGAAAMIEINTETDFTARNDSVIETADKIADVALEGGEGEIEVNDQITALIDEIRLTTKENISFARGVKFAAGSGGKVGSYLHHNRQIGALVVVEGDVDDETLTGLAQHVTAADGLTMPMPLAVDEAGLPADAVETRKTEFITEAQESGKPQEIAEKISTGKLRKWIDENTLLGQAYVKDMTGKTKIGDLLNGAKVLKFIRYQVGVK